MAPTETRLTIRHPNYCIHRRICLMQTTISLRNLGAKPKGGNKGGDAFLLDYNQSTIQLAKAGVSGMSYSYTDIGALTLHDGVVSPLNIKKLIPLTYTGIWGNNTGPNFNGGGTAFTNDNLASALLSFHILGDKKSDH